VSVFILSGLFQGARFASALDVPDDAILYYDDSDEFEEDLPYLSEEDEASIQMALPEDTPENPLQPEEPESPKKTEAPKKQREAQQYLYHLLILDRLDCPSADIAAARDMTVLYSFKHGANGYLIAFYRTPAAGPMLPELPDESRIVLSLSAARTSILKDFVNSNPFRLHITHRAVIAELLKLL
jgi:hypothetical protein